MILSPEISTRHSKPKERQETLSKTDSSFATVITVSRLIQNPKRYTGKQQVVCYNCLNKKGLLSRLFKLIIIIKYMGTEKQEKLERMKNFFFLFSHLIIFIYIIVISLGYRIFFIRIFFISAPFFIPLAF